MTIDWATVADEATSLLSRYLQIDTTNAPGNELAAAAFLASELEHCGFEPTVYTSAPGRGNVVARLPRTTPEPGAGAIILLHHMDVVPADAGRWSCDPFGGEIRDGYVWGRGALDMKGMGVMQLLALDLLLQDGHPRTRDLIFLAVADEEVSSEPGVRWMLANHAPELDAAIVWDEGGFGLQGIFGPGTVFTVAVAEKQALWLRLVAEGEPGHSGTPHGANANDLLVAALSRIRKRRVPLRLHRVVDAMFRAVAQGQPFPTSWLMRHLDHPLVLALARKGLTASPAVAAMLQNTLSVTGLQAGSKINVVPERAEALLDVRLLPGESVDDYLEVLQKTIADARIRVEVIQPPSPNSVSDYEGPFFQALAEVTGRIVPGSLTAPLLTPGATDSAFFRQRGLNAYGLFPAVITPEELQRFHGIDERISVENLRLGTQIMYEVLRRVCGR